jgi:hypothetical protein
VVTICQLERARSNLTRARVGRATSGTLTRALHGGAVAMGNNSSQGVALLVLLIAFTLLSISRFYDGNIVFLLLGLATLAGSIAMFRKVKPLEQ